MTIMGFSYWGFCEEYNNSSIIETPDGGRFTRPIFVKELLKRNIEVIALQQRRETYPLNGLKFDEGFPEIDFLFIEYRWGTWKNDIRNVNFKADYYESDLDRQTKLINLYYGKIPIIIWDTDLKVTDDFIKKYPKIIFTEPSFFPLRSSIISMPYFTDYNINLFDVKIPSRQIVYIGSNYERYWALEKYFFNIGDKCKNANIAINFYGNWLNFSVERPEQKEKIKHYSSKINFNGRNNFIEGMKILNDSIATIHLTKQSYCDFGLITPRYFESLACNCPAFIPKEFPLELYGRKFMADKNLFDTIDFISTISLDGRKNIIGIQKEHAEKYFPETKVSYFVDSLLEIAK